MSRKRTFVWEAYENRMCRWAWRGEGQSGFIDGELFGYLPGDERGIVLRIMDSEEGVERELFARYVWDVKVLGRVK